MDNINTFDSRETLEHQAREWIVRLDSDDPLTSPEKQALRDWVERSPAHRKELQRLAEFWDSSNILTELLIPMHQVARVKRQHYSWRSLLAGLFSTPRGGAALAMTLLFTVVIIRGGLFPVAPESTNGIYAAAIGELRIETLADGSVLHINTDSQVQVSYSEQTRKIRLLRGEAHFDVAHNTGWPFEVYAGKGLVKAVGTAFLVRLEQERLSVIVTDGKVDLAAQSPSASPNTITTPLPTLEKVGSLSKGEGASFNTANNPKAHIKLAQKDITRQLAWREGYLVFEGEPLTVVVAELNRYLPMRVEIADDSLNQIPIGGRFKVGELEALFEVLETSFNVHVSRLDDRHIQLFEKPKLVPGNNAKNHTDNKK